MILDASGVPVVIDLWVESSDYRDAELELSRREEAIPQPDDPPPGPFSPADPGIAAVDWISVDENGYLVAQAADIALLAELHEEARTSDLLQVKSPTTKPTKPSRPSGTRSRIKNAANTPTYAEQLTSAVHARPAALNLPTPVTVNITLAPEGARSDDLDDHAPATHPRNAIEAAIHDTIANTPTPSALPGTTLDRLAAPQPEGS